MPGQEARGGPARKVTSLPTEAGGVLGHLGLAPLPKRLGGIRSAASQNVVGRKCLQEKLDAIRRLDVTIVVAGMDAALVSVMGGLTRGVVIAVPTSIGYGAARGGETALHAALASCAPGVVVVNIDNGFGAACAALRVLNIKQ